MTNMVRHFVFLLTAGCVVWLTSGNLRCYAQNEQSLGRVTLQSVNFDQTDLESALDYLAAKAESTNPEVTPVNILLIDPDGKLKDKKITLQLNSVPWPAALKYTCDLAGLVGMRDGPVILVGEKSAVQKMGLSRSKIQAGAGSDRTRARLASTMVESVSFRDTSLAEIAEYLRLAGFAKGGTDSQATVNVLIKENIAKPVATRTVSLKLRQVSLADLLHFATGLADSRYRVDARAVVIGEPEDLSRIPGGPRRPSGHIFNRLAATTINSIDVPPGTTAKEFLEVVRQLGGVNGINMATDAVASARLAMENVTTLELLRYFNEASGTAYRLDTNAFIVTDDPAVPRKPKPPEPLVDSTPATGSNTPAALGFDP